MQEKKIKVMNWWRKMVVPVRKVWFAVSTRSKTRKNVGGLMKLRDHVQSCDYRDVHVMWEMLSKNDSAMVMSRYNKRKKKSFWRIFVWSHKSKSTTRSKKAGPSK